MIKQIEYFSSLKRFEYDLITQMLFSLSFCFVFLRDKKKFSVFIHTCIFASAIASVTDLLMIPYPLVGFIQAKPHMTEYGKSLQTILEMMHEWGEAHLQRKTEMLLSKGTDNQNNKND
ncbi:hypothetical protein [Ammoniphilus resinae]|uniref:Uncharacterized protein n=1 Tax=Ammoniphilus resinae TaxID=861532 RepID=A0ABS4GXE9_9BACL|nr:hypothetical protein [Ammoniphilus resinae]MBP1934955.1 hypothetical protein [Ammoniphilus resinae]